jgi:voltage-gated potassium channel
MEVEKNIKELPKRIFIFLILLVFLLAFGTIGFKAIEKISFEQAFSRTMGTLAFRFEAEQGISKALEIFLSIFGLLTIWWIFWSFFDLLLTGNLTEYLKTSRFLHKVKKMRNHYIIAGGGRVGEEIAFKLKKDKKQYIIIEKDSGKVDKLKKKGFNVIAGDVTNSDYSDLIDAGIKNAKTIISTLPETEKNLLFTMSAKEINPRIDIFARADNPAFASKLKKAGAKTVVVPEIAAAKEFLESIK